MSSQHNHVTRDIKPPGQCPGCDEYHRSQQEGHRAEPSTRGESDTRGESATAAAVDVAQRAVLVQRLRDIGFGGCADDLAGAGTEGCGPANEDPAQVAYDVAGHIAYFSESEEAPDLAAKLREWADRHERLQP